MPNGTPEGGWWETVGGLRERVIEVEQALKAHTMLHSRDDQYDTGAHDALAARVAGNTADIRDLKDAFLEFRGEIRGALQGFKWMAGLVSLLVTAMTGITVAVQLGWLA